MTNEILHYYEDGSILIDISTRKYPLATSRMDKKVFDRFEGRIRLGGQGYPETRVNGKTKLVHQTVLPDAPRGKQRDHINRVRTDNRRCNLRFVTPRENCMNRSDNTSGVPGVCWNDQAKKWQAYIRINGIDKHLGRFNSLHDAQIARKAAEATIDLPHDIDII